MSHSSPQSGNTGEKKMTNPESSSPFFLWIAQSNPEKTPKTTTCLTSFNKGLLYFPVECPFPSHCLCLLPQDPASSQLQLEGGHKHIRPSIVPTSMEKYFDH